MSVPKKRILSASVDIGMNRISELTATLDHPSFSGAGTLEFMQIHDPPCCKWGLLQSLDADRPPFVTPFPDVSQGALW